MDFYVCDAVVKHCVAPDQSQLFKSSVLRNNIVYFVVGAGGWQTLMDGTNKWKRCLG